MADLSNNALALLLLVVVVASLSSTVFVLQSGPGGGLSPVGFATEDAGKTNFSISTELSIRFIESVVPFGVGRVNVSYGNRCYMGTNNSPPDLDVSSGCVSFNTTVHTQNLTIENDGNILANISLNFTKNASTFIGGSVATPSFQYDVRDSEANSCNVIMNTSGGFKEVGATEVVPAGARVCNSLNTTVSRNLIQVGFWVLIPLDAASGEHTVALTAIACADDSC